MEQIYRIGIDHGYGNIKTAHHIFESGIIGEELKNGSLMPVKTELDEKLYDSVYVYHKNKWISPQMGLALDLLKEYLGKENV